MKQSASLKKFPLKLLRPGITINSSPNDFAPLKQLQMQRFNGERFELIGPVIPSEVDWEPGFVEIVKCRWLCFRIFVWSFASLVITSQACT
jgi:hypothetical protein